MEPGEDYGALSARLAELGGDLVVRALDLRASSHLELADQDESPATYAGKIAPEERRLDPLSAVQEDVLSALENLGYQRTAAEKALTSVEHDGAFDAMFRAALAVMAK